MRRALPRIILSIFCLVALLIPQAQAHIIGNIELDPNPLNYGPTNVGATSQGTVTVRKKSGFLPVLVFGSFLTHPFHFSQNDGCAFVLLDDNNSCEIETTFSPNREGFFHSHLVVLATDRHVLNFGSLIGRGVRPVVELDPTNIDYGSQPQGVATPPTFVQVTNVGTGDLNVSQVAITQGSNVFSIDSEDCTSAPVPPQGSCMVGVIFTPDAIADFTGELSISDDADDSPQTVSLEGQGVAASPAITLNTNLLDFGYQLINTSSGAMTVTLTSSGNVILNITAITSSLPAVYPFSGTCISGLPLALNPGETCDLDVTFTPDVLGEILGSTTFTSDAVDAPALNFEGMGFSGTPDFGISADNLDFGELMVGLTSDPQTVTITNTSDAPLRFQSISLGGTDPHGFAMVDECSDGVIPPGGTCLIEVVFTPHEDGTYSATITLIDENGVTGVITLNGSATGAEISGGSRFCALGKGPVTIPWIGLGLLVVFLLGMLTFRKSKR